MKCPLVAATSLAVLAVSSAASAQDPAAVYQKKNEAFRFAGDTIVRYEWTREIPVAAVGGAEITTIEGISGRESEAVQRAWVARDVPQCGYCQSGQVMSAVALLKAIKKPSDRDIDRAMNGNLCRCATYVRIRAAIHDAARALEG